jgi:hypothetical protein
MEFERRAPDGHQEFLLSLGIPAGEVARIRGWSRGERENYELPEGVSPELVTGRGHGKG